MKNKKYNSILYAFIILIIYGILLFLIKTKLNNYYIGIIAMILINIILAVSLNLVTGFLGQLALGHAGFMSIGAYTSAIISTHLNLPPLLLFPVSIFISGVIAAIFGTLIGLPSLSLKGDYLAIITLGFGEIIKNIVINLKITGGGKGFKRIPQYNQDFPINNLINFTVIFFLAVLTIYVISSYIKSRHGRAVISIREDEIASEASGINITYYKIFAFSLGAFFAGIAGALFAHHSGFIIPGKFDFNYSVELVIMVVLGGMGSIKGSIAAATFLTLLFQVLSGFDNYRMLVYSILLISIIIFKSSSSYQKLLDSNFLKFKSKG